MKPNPKRRTISKKERELIRRKYNERCTYCGELLLDRFCVDHFESFRNSQNENFDNLVPSCFKCNNFKDTFSIEQFRREMEKQVERARKYSVNFRFAEKFGLIEERKIPVVFYFERVGTKRGQNDGE